MIDETLVTEARAKVRLARNAPSHAAAADAWTAAADRYREAGMPGASIACRQAAAAARWRAERHRLVARAAYTPGEAKPDGGAE